MMRSRRDILCVAASAMACAALPKRKGEKPADNSLLELHVYDIDDGGEWYWYVAANEADAVELHRHFNYTLAGEPWVPELADHLGCRELPDDEILTVVDVGVKPAGTWVSSQGRGFLASTAAC